MTAANGQPVRPSRVLIVGNGGSGKTWLARQLGASMRLPIVHLDDMHWEPGHRGIARDRGLRDANVLAAAQADAWIMEGVYGQLASLVLDRVTAFIWIDLPVDECIDNIRRRGLQGGESQAQFDDLINWVAAYRTRVNNWNSSETHQRLFSGYSGPKLRPTSRQEITGLTQSLPVRHGAEPR